MHERMINHGDIAICLYMSYFVALLLIHVSK